MERVKQQIKVTFSNGDYLYTSIYGTNESILEYYRMDKIFNLGNGGNDNLVKVRSVEFLNNDNGGTK